MRLRDCQCDKPDCPECGPLVALAEQVRREFEHTRQQAQVPTPEIVWWRAQMRAREEAARTAARPIVFTQALALAALIGLLVSVVGRLTLPVLSWAVFPALPAGLPLVAIAIAAVCWLVIAPAVLYFAFSRD
jgi:Flp pilus assembly protein TadB